MRRVDLFASKAHYAAHLEPAWSALPDELRGERNPRGEPARGRAALVSSHRDLLVAHRDGYRAIAYLEHGIGQPYAGAFGYPGGVGRDAVGLFLSPNETAAAADRGAYPRARIVVVGDPRLDTLPRRGDGPGPVVAISFHWECRIVEETRSAWRHYAGTLRALAERFAIIGHAHPKASRSIARAFAEAGTEFVRDFDEVCRRADVYVADNSSTLYEFAATGRPVVVLNAPWYRRSIEYGLRFWEAADVGPQVDGPAELADTIWRAWIWRDHPAEVARREAALDLAYGHRSGAGARAAAAIGDWLAA